MSILYVIFIVFVVYTIMNGIISLLSAIVPSIMVFNKLIKNKKRYFDVEKEGKKITLILNEEENINEFILKINDLTNLDYEDYDIYVVACGENDLLIKKIISTFHLQKKNKSFLYGINKEEIISFYSNNKINLLIKEKSSKWNNINAVIDNIDSDLFMVVEENISLERSSLNKLVRQFMLYDDNLFSMGIIKTKAYIEEENLNYRGIKNHNFLLGGVILKSIKNKLFLKTFNEEFCCGFENGNNFTLYNKEKVKNVGGFSSNNINPNNDLKYRLTCKYGERYYIDYEAFAFKKEEESKHYLQNEMYSTYINMKNQNTINSFMGLSKFYGFLSSVLNPILELPIIVFSLIFVFLKVITIKEFLLFILLYISFDILKNIILVITDKISIGKNTNIIETLELFGYCIIYDFGLRQFYDLNKLFIRLHKEEKKEEYYLDNELFGYFKEKSFVIDKKLQNKVNSISIIDNKKQNKNIKLDRENKQNPLEESEFDIPIYVEESKEKDNLTHTSDLENIIDEINSFQVDDNIINENKISKEEPKEEIKEIEENDDILDGEKSYLEDSKEIDDIVTSKEKNVTVKEEKDEPIKKDVQNKNSDLQKIIKQVEQTYSKIEELEKAVSKELNNIERRNENKDINKEIDKLKNEIESQQEKIKSYDSENTAREEIASASLDDLSEDEINKEFENITI